VTVRLGVNIDHVATIRNARGETYPDPALAAQEATRGGADLITCHLRFDQRHIRRGDLDAIRAASPVLNFEIAVEEGALEIARGLKPDWVCLVPERREELTTEGGLHLSAVPRLGACIQGLQAVGIKVSLFVETDPETLRRAADLGADAVELHTGRYANRTGPDQVRELDRLRQGAALCHTLGVGAHGGHGLTLDNLAAVAAIPELEELNIGHAIIADALFRGGLRATVEDYKACMLRARDGLG